MRQFPAFLVIWRRGQALQVELEDVPVVIGRGLAREEEALAVHGDVRLTGAVEPGGQDPQAAIGSKQQQPGAPRASGRDWDRTEPSRMGPGSGRWEVERAWHRGGPRSLLPALAPGRGPGFEEAGLLERAGDSCGGGIEKSSSGKPATLRTRRTRRDRIFTASSPERPFRPTRAMIHARTAIVRASQGARPRPGGMGWPGIVGHLPMSSLPGRGRLASAESRVQTVRTGPSWSRNEPGGNPPL